MKKATREFLEVYLKADEGELHQISGKVKNGKSLLATKLAWEDLMRGQVVIANWPIFWEGYDERNNWWKLFLHLIRWKKVLLTIPKDNFIYLDPHQPLEMILARIAMTTDAKLYLDEGHRYFDSYVKTTMAMENREIALLTAHFDRTITIISQRPTAIHATLRGNVNRFFKVVKTLPIFGIFGPKFYVIETQEMTAGEIPDWDNAESQKTFWGSKKWYKRYNYKSMRGDVPRSQPNYANAWILNPIDIFQYAFKKREDITPLIPTPEDLKTGT